MGWVVGWEETDSVGVARVIEGDEELPKEVEASKRREQHQSALLSRQLWCAAIETPLSPNVVISARAILRKVGGGRPV